MVYSYTILLIERRMQCSIYDECILYTVLIYDILPCGLFMFVFSLLLKLLFQMLKKIIKFVNKFYSGLNKN